MVCGWNVRCFCLLFVLRNEIPTNSSVFKTLATLRLVYKFTTVCMSIGCDLHVDLSSLYGLQLHHFLMPLQFCITTLVPCSVRSLMFQSLCSLLLRRWSVLNSKGIMFSIHCRSVYSTIKSLISCSWKAGLKHHTYDHTTEWHMYNDTRIYGGKIWNSKVKASYW